MTMPRAREWEAEPCRHPPLPDGCGSCAQPRGAELMRPVEPGSELHGRRTVGRETRGCPLADRSCPDQKLTAPTHDA